MSKTNISLNKFFSVDVRKNYTDIILLVIEDIRLLDKYFRSSRVHLWLEIMSREKDAYVLAFMRDSSPAASDPWRLSELDRAWQWELRHKRVATESRMDWARVARKQRLFFGDFIFEDLPAEVWEEYHRARIAAKEEYEKSLNAPEKEKHGCEKISEGEVCGKKATTLKPWGWACEKHKIFEAK